MSGDTAVNEVRTTHTPGPWYADEHRGDIEIVGRPEWPCRRHNAKGEWTVAKLDDLDFGHDEEVRANARLIAAAPELLAAAREALRFISDIDNAHASVRLLRSAIASAESSS